MAQQISGFFDLGKGLMVGDPREDEARAKEASSRAERALRAQMAAQALSMSQRGGGGYSMQGSPNGGGSETARRGHEISNPWNRPDSRPQVSGGFAGGGNLGGMSQNYQPGMARGGPTVSSTAYAFNPSQAFDGGVRPEREAILAEIEGGRQRKFQEDLALGEQKRLVRKDEESSNLARKGMEMESDYKGRALQAQIAQFLAGLHEQSSGRRAQESAQARSEADALLGPHMETIRSGSPLDEATVTLLQAEGRRNPALQRQLDQILSTPGFRPQWQPSAARDVASSTFGNLARMLGADPMYHVESSQERYLRAQRALARAAGAPEDSKIDDFWNRRREEEPVAGNPAAQALLRLLNSGYGK